MGKGISGVPIVAGGVVGLLFFVLASLWLGKPVIPTIAEVESKAVYPAPEPLPPVPSADEETELDALGRGLHLLEERIQFGMVLPFLLKELSHNME